MSNGAPNGCVNRAAGRARICRVANAILERPGNDDNSLIKEDCSSVFPLGVISVILLGTAGQGDSRPKSG